MQTTFRHSISTRVLLIMLAMLIIVQPMLVSSSPPIPTRPLANTTLASSAERYITSIGNVVRLSTALIGPIEAIRTTLPPQLPEAFVAQTRQQALDLAVQASIAIGAVDDFTAEIEKLGGTLPPAIDIAQTVAAGLPPETKQDFQQVVGLNAAQITSIEQSLQELATTRFAIAQTGLPQETQNQLIQAGFSQADIDHITQTLANKGITNPALTTRLDQFRATQWELAILRTRALILATQLMREHMTARQAHGVAPQPATQHDMAELANDEIRLLTHSAALQAAWGNDPRLERGEGHWWFIERYAQRASERLERLMVTTQNLAFATDLFFIDQLRTLSITARSGDPAFVKPALAQLSALLAFQLGDPAVDSRQAIAAADTEIVRTDAGRSVVAAWVVDPAMRDQVIFIANTRMMAAQTGAVGVVAEADETNNTSGFIFPYVADAAVQLAPEITAALEENFGHVNPGLEKERAWFWGVVTGKSNDWRVLVVNFALSVIPVLGVLPDLATLATSDDWFEKAFAVIGVIASVGDLLALVPGLQAPGGGSFVADSLAAGLKITYKNLASSGARGVLKNLASFDVAFTLAKGLIEAAGKLFVKELTSLINSPGAFLDFVKGIWGNFDALVKTLKEPGLRQMGVTMGGLMLGGLINRGKQISENLAQPVIRLFDRVAGTSLAKSDEALAGIAEVVDDVGEPGAWRALERLGCVTQAATAQVSARPAVIALLDAPVAHAEESDPCALATAFLKAVYNTSDIKWADEGLEGLEAILRRGPKDTVEAYAKGIVTALKGKFSQDVIQQSLAVLGKQTTAWSEEAAQGLAQVIAWKDREFTENIIKLLETKRRSHAPLNNDQLANVFEILSNQATKWPEDSLSDSIEGIARLILLKDEPTIAKEISNLLDDGAKGVAFANVGLIKQNVFDIFFTASDKISSGNVAAILNGYTGRQHVNLLGAVINSRYANRAPNDLASEIIAMDRSQMLDLLKKFQQNVEPQRLREGMTAYRDGITNLEGRWHGLEFSYVRPFDAPAHLTTLGDVETYLRTKVTPAQVEEALHEIAALQVVSKDFTLIGAGDQGVKKALTSALGSLPSQLKPADFLGFKEDASIITIMLGDAKRVGAINGRVVQDIEGKAQDMITQINGCISRGCFTGSTVEFAPFEIVVPKDTPFAGGYGSDAAGFLFDSSGQAVMVEGVPIKVRFI